MLMLKKQNVLEAIREIHEQCKTEAEELRVWEVYRAIDEMMPDSGIVPQVVKTRYNRYSKQVQAVLSLDTKQMDKIFLQEFDCEDLNDVCGMNLRDYDAAELETKPVAVQAVVGGCIVSAVKARDGELIFYDNNYLQPLADVLKDSDYLEMTVRRMASGQRYIAVKDGFNMLAAIMPVRVVSDKYIADLQEFEALCVDQLFRERARAETKALEGNQNETK